MLGGPPLFAVALGAHVKCGFGIVMACQVSGRIRTPRAKFDSHVPPSMAKRQASSPSWLWFAGGAHSRFQASGLSRLHSIFSAVTVDILLPAIGFQVTAKLKCARLRLNCT